MSGVAILSALLTAHTPLVTVVGDQIIPGDMPQGMAAPAVALRHISGADRQVVAATAGGRVTERIQATAIAGNYVQQKQLIGLVRAAAAGFIGSIAAFSAVVVLTDGTGPDLENDTGLFMQPQDFRVSYNP